MDPHDCQAVGVRGKALSSLRAVRLDERLNFPRLTSGRVERAVLNFTREIH